MQSDGRSRDIIVRGDVSAQRLADFGYNPRHGKGKGVYMELSRDTDGGCVCSWCLAGKRNGVASGQVKVDLRLVRRGHKVMG